MKNKIYNEDCIITMQNMASNNIKCNMILTSPPYNTGRPSTSEKSRSNYEGRYDVHLDTMSPDEYCNWCIELFNNFDSILEKDGVVAWNVSYGTDNTGNPNSIGLMWLTIADIIRNTSFTVADRIIWKKNSSLPNNVSPNKLTRIVEDIFIFCRKDEYNTFQCNKTIKSVRKTGQKSYIPIYNYIEAPNNDGSCDLNKATYSSEMCEKVLNIYSKKGDLIYDPFMGTGTTAVACIKYGDDYIGSEISSNQCKFAEDRIHKFIDYQNYINAKLSLF